MVISRTTTEVTAPTKLSPKHQPRWSDDDILELLSIFKPHTVREMTAQVAMAKYMAQADLAEQDVSPGGKTILERHRNLANRFAELIVDSQIEIASLREPIS